MMVMQNKVGRMELITVFPAMVLVRPSAWRNSYCSGSGGAAMGLQYNLNKLLLSIK